jgi:hypothetical protein
MTTKYSQTMQGYACTGGHIPSQNELRIAQRELKTRTHTADTRHGSRENFHRLFRVWLHTAGDELKVILAFKGLPDTRVEPTPVPSGGEATRQPFLHPFLPACLHYLEVLARGEYPPYEASGLAASTLFERGTADAFRSLGFDIKQLGQGTGRNADCLACAPKEHVALIIDSKVRTNGYALGPRAENSWITLSAMVPNS